MKNFIKENWFKIIIAVVVLIIVLSIGYYVKQRSNKQLSNLERQTFCSDMALKFFHYKNYGISDGYTYTNHYNSKLSKCFILVSYYKTDSDLLALDLYDASEGKRYAMYTGHNDCNPLTILNDSKKCQLDSGDIWLNGNDTKNPSDYHVGFEGVTVSHNIGDENTQKQFMEHIQPFMNE